MVAAQAHVAGIPSVSSEEQITQQSESESATRAVAVYSCQEDDCVKVYKDYRSLMEHLDAGRHLYKLKRESDYDMIVAKWAETCKIISGDYVKSAAPSTTELTAEPAHSPSLKGGWALKKAKKSIRFSPRVRSFLQEIFLQVEETGNKANPSDVSAKMKRIRSTDGDKLFSMKEWLSAVQMTWYFSRLSPHNKNGLLNRDVSAYHEDEDDFQYVNEVEAMNTRFQIRRELEI